MMSPFDVFGLNNFVGFSCDKRSRKRVPSDVKQAILGHSFPGAKASIIDQSNPVLGIPSPELVPKARAPCPEPGDPVRKTYLHALWCAPAVISHAMASSDSSGGRN